MRSIGKGLPTLKGWGLTRKIDKRVDKSKKSCENTCGQYKSLVLVIPATNTNSDNKSDIRSHKVSVQGRDAPLTGGAVNFYLEMV